MRLTLIESTRKTDGTKLFRVACVSLVLHAALIVGVAYGTVHAARSDTTVHVDTTLVLLEAQQQHKPPAPAPLDEPLKGFQTVAVLPEIPSVIPPVYPALLKRVGIQGRVVIRAVIDTMGRVDPTSVRIIKSPNPGFDEPTKQWVLKALFRPARLHGQAVRVIVNLPFDYSIER